MFKMSRIILFISSVVWALHISLSCTVISDSMTNVVTDVQSTLADVMTVRCQLVQFSSCLANELMWSVVLDMGIESPVAIYSHENTMGDHLSVSKYSEVVEVHYARSQWCNLTDGASHVTCILRNTTGGDISGQSANLTNTNYWCQNNDCVNVNHIIHEEWVRLAITYNDLLNVVDVRCWDPYLPDNICLPITGIEYTLGVQAMRIADGKLSPDKISENDWNVHPMNYTIGASTSVPRDIFCKHLEQIDTCSGIYAASCLVRTISKSRKDILRVYPTHFTAVDMHCDTSFTQTPTAIKSAIAVTASDIEVTGGSWTSVIPIVVSEAPDVGVGSLVYLKWTLIGIAALILMLLCVILPPFCSRRHTSRRQNNGQSNKSDY